jgi:hypothetical protein
LVRILGLRLSGGGGVVVVVQEVVIGMDRILVNGMSKDDEGIEKALDPVGLLTGNERNHVGNLDGF